MRCEPESQELLAFCLKKIKGLSKVKMVNAGFIWTEPHSKRIKVKLTVQKEVQAGAVLETTFVVEYIIKNQQCDDCKKNWTPHKWTAVVQVRQKVDHKRTMMYLEQIILRNNMHTKTIKIKEQPNGIDFYFATKLGAVMLSDFIHAQIISHAKQSSQLISSDYTSNDPNLTTTFNVELAAICREDLVYIPRKLQKELGGAFALCLVQRVTSMVQLLDVASLKSYTIDENCYWNNTIETVCSKKQMSEFVVISIDPFKKPAATGADKSAAADEDYCIANVELQRLVDFGENDNRLLTRTHLGNVLKVDDHVLGYDMSSINATMMEYVEGEIPDVVIVKKHYTKPKQKRSFRLKQLDMEKEEKEKKAGGRHPSKRQEEKDVCDMFEPRIVEGLRGVPRGGGGRPRAAFQD